MEARLSLPTVRNFHQVNDWLYRGGQPDERQLQELYDFGIRAVISFRFRDSMREWEEAACKRIGLKFYAMPLNYTTVPRAKHVEEFFKILDHLDNRNVFVHCYHGSDRTGLLIGIYRITRDGWTFKDAYKEMKAFGFHRFRIRPFKWVLNQYYKNHLKTKI